MIKYDKNNKAINNNKLNIYKNCEYIQIFSQKNPLDTGIIFIVLTNEIKKKRKKGNCKKISYSTKSTLQL